MGNLTAATTFTQEKYVGMAIESSFPATNAKQVWEGGAVAFDANGTLVSAGDGTAVQAAGVAMVSQLGDGSTQVRFKHSSIFRFANGVNALAIANRGQACYFESDQAVGSSSATGIFAGIVYDVDAAGVWVFMPGIVFSGITLSGALTGTTATFSGAVSFMEKTAVKTTNYSVLTTDAGGLLQSATDTVQFTLPATGAANKGMSITIQNTAAAAAAGIQVLLASGTDKILGTVGSVHATGTAGHGWSNTKATAQQGDFTTLESDGNGVWWIVGGVGVWASL